MSDSMIKIIALRPSRGQQQGKDGTMSLVIQASENSVIQAVQITKVGLLRQVTKYMNEQEQMWHRKLPPNHACLK